jgi:hypothetical protein
MVTLSILIGKQNSFCKYSLQPTLNRSHPWCEIKFRRRGVSFPLKLFKTLGTDQLANFNERDGSLLFFFFVPLFYSRPRAVSDSWYLFQQGASKAAEAAACHVV